MNNGSSGKLSERYDGQFRHEPWCKNRFLTYIFLEEVEKDL